MGGSRATYYCCKDILYIEYKWRIESKGYEVWLAHGQMLGADYSGKKKSKFKSVKYSIVYRPKGLPEVTSDQ